MLVTDALLCQALYPPNTIAHKKRKTAYGMMQMRTLHYVSETKQWIDIKEYIVQRIENKRLQLSKTYKNNGTP